MAILKTEKQAKDNKYLHRDFHISADIGLQYVGENFGGEGVTEYLTRFTKNYYAPLIAKVKAEGLNALAENITGVYMAEEAEDALDLTLSDGWLQVKINYCPAVRHMRSNGREPSVWYEQTTRTVYAVLAKECGLIFEMDAYDPQTGKTSYCFTEVKT